MNNDVHMFNNLKVKEVNGQVLFDAESTAIGLGIVDTSKGTMKVRWARVNKYLSLDGVTAPQVALGSFITEPQFYKLAIKANNETAEKFQDWVTSEVLPAIRKHGAYMNSQTIEQVLTDPDTIIRIATDLKKEREQNVALSKRVNELEPKALFADAVSASESSILIGDLAKLLKQNGIEIGQNRLFSWLRDNKYLSSRKGDSYNSPTQRSMDMGLMEVKETVILRGGKSKVSKTPKITGKGQNYFINKFMNYMEVVE